MGTKRGARRLHILVYHLSLDHNEDNPVLMPDAKKNYALNVITGAAFGAAGHRCMGLSVRTSTFVFSNDLPI